MTYIDMLKDTALFWLDKGTTRGDMITIVTYVEGCCKEKVMNYPLCLMD